MQTFPVSAQSYESGAIIDIRVEKDSFLPNREIEIDVVINNDGVDSTEYELDVIIIGPLGDEVFNSSEDRRQRVSVLAGDTVTETVVWPSKTRSDAGQGDDILGLLIESPKMSSPCPAHVFDAGCPDDSGLDADVPRFGAVLQ